MGDWVVGAFINIIGSIAINYGTNLLKLGHDQRERHSVLINDGSNNKLNVKSVIHFQTWRVGILFFAFGNCLNFVSFAYAAQSLLAALGSIQFVSNIAFAYFVLSKTVSVKVLVATTFIVFGNIFLVSFGNHQSPVYTPEELIAKYTSVVFLFYCMTLLLVVGINQYIYRKGETCLSISSHVSPYWRTLLPFSYATVSGALGSCSVLFAKSLSNMLRLTMSSNYQFHSWFTYCMLLLFFSTAAFWMARLNEGLSLFDAILIVPMFQIAWTFFSICTGFVYFQEYQVFNTLRITMFVVGMAFVFIGISLLAPDDSKGSEVKDYSLPSSAQGLQTDMNRFAKLPTEDIQKNDGRSFAKKMFTKAKVILLKAKTAGSLSLGLGDDSINASSVLVMPMVSSRTTGFRGTMFDRSKFIPSRNTGRSYPPIDDDHDGEMRDTRLSLTVGYGIFLNPSELSPRADPDPFCLAGNLLELGFSNKAFCADLGRLVLAHPRASTGVQLGLEGPFTPLKQLVIQSFEDDYSPGPNCGSIVDSCSFVDVLPPDPAPLLPDGNDFTSLASGVISSPTADFGKKRKPPPSSSVRRSARLISKEYISAHKKAEARKVAIANGTRSQISHPISTSSQLGLINVKAATCLSVDILYSIQDLGFICPGSPLDMARALAALEA
ncbi:putative magnesium transporter NIPA8 [Canna indica]|uniref:Probable magnesium transporter n=1 Tax=Canna indica TaxID=4628 RepID=A0AAQ3KA07_9LILI|nr:putative magnesium transporter NIPA8 [Canna indica]